MGNILHCPMFFEKEVPALFSAFSYPVEAASRRHRGEREFLVTCRSTLFIELLIVEEH